MCQLNSINIALEQRRTQTLSVSIHPTKAQKASAEHKNVFHIIFQATLLLYRI